MGDRNGSGYGAAALKAHAVFNKKALRDDVAVETTGREECNAARSVN